MATREDSVTISSKLYGRQEAKLGFKARLLKTSETRSLYGCATTTWSLLKKHFNKLRTIVQRIDQVVVLSQTLGAREEGGLRHCRGEAANVHTRREWGSYAWGMSRVPPSRLEVTEKDDVVNSRKSK